jgi:Skp family chaperone for outer membrane proteins
MEQLLLVTTRQTEELIATFQDRFRKLKTEHKADLHKLMRGSDQDRSDNQKYLKRLRKMYKKKISELESDHRIFFAEMEDKHQKKIVSILLILVHPC